jgi:hypothetical protein
VMVRKDRCEKSTVHSGTAPFSTSPYTMDMQLQAIKGTIAVVWMSAAVATGLAIGLTTLLGWTVLTAVCILPPLVMAWWWSDPRQTLSESIQEARR